MDNRLVRFTKWLLDAMFYGGLVITLGIPVIFRYVGRYIQSFRVHYIPEQAGTYRGCYGADTKVHDQHKSEMHRTHSNAGGDWKEDWSENQHGRSQIQKHTHHQQEHIHD